MKDEKHKGGGPAGTPGKPQGQDQKKNPRQDRLKLALRENLKRRKSQTRGRTTIMPSNEDEISRDQAGGKKPGE
jgi:hypothetical protein